MSRLRWGRWRIQIRRICEIEEVADVRLSRVTGSEHLQIKTLFNEAQNSRRVHGGVVHVVRF